MRLQQPPYVLAKPSLWVMFPSMKLLRLKVRGSLTSYFVWLLVRRCCALVIKKVTNGRSVIKRGTEKRYRTTSLKYDPAH